MDTSALERHLERMDRDGFTILERVLAPEQIAAIVSALAPYEGARPHGRNDFEGRASKRVYSLAGKGAPFLDLAAHPSVVAIVDRLLAPNWLLSTLQSIRLFPGETEQPWHVDDSFYLVPGPRPRLAVSAIWALEDFTEENGATELIAGSHLGGSPERGAPVQAIMPAGSVVLFDGRLWHRGGANRSRGTRLAISPQYCQPWLRPQESQLLIVPPEKARACSARVRSMLGYSIHPPFIGQVDGMHPLRLVDPSYGSDGRRHLTEAAALADRILVPDRFDQG